MVGVGTAVCFDWGLTVDGIDRVWGRTFVTGFRQHLGVKGRYREIARNLETYAIRENRIRYESKEQPLNID